MKFENKNKMSVWKYCVPFIVLVFDVVECETDLEYQHRAIHMLEETIYKRQQPIRSIDSYRCRNGTKISFDLACNGKRDCAGGEDEYRCKGCNDNEYKCPFKFCYEPPIRCNGYPECLDGRDESNCSTCVGDAVHCPITGTQCVLKELVCDRRKRCSYIDVEINCTSCQLNAFNCQDGTCIGLEKKCNGIENCKDGSDEQNCYHSAKCALNGFYCSEDRCITHKLKCNGKTDCKDGSDEQNCSRCNDAYRCANGQCIFHNWKCNGNKDCEDGSDERNCSNCNDAFNCNDGQCITNSLVCNGRKDCDMGNDERLCDELVSLAEHDRLSLPSDRRERKPRQQRRRRLCGSDLADAYDLICSQSAQNGKRSYQPADVPEASYQRRGSWRDIRDAPDFNDPFNEELSAMASKLRHRRETHDVNPAKTGLARFTRQTSNIVVECCLNPCSITDIMGYCPAGYTPPSKSTLSKLERNLGFTTRRPATQRPIPTQPPSTTTSAYPPAQINRGKTGISNPDVFFVNFSNQATRSPL